MRMVLVGGLLVGFAGPLGCGSDPACDAGATRCTGTVREACCSPGDWGLCWGSHTSKTEWILIGDCADIGMTCRDGTCQKQAPATRDAQLDCSAPGQGQAMPDGEPAN
jgi:hypothetical protein